MKETKEKPMTIDEARRAQRRQGRIARVEAAMSVYHAEPGDLRDAMVELLADYLHLADSLGQPFEEKEELLRTTLFMAMSRYSKDL
jgi:hypothetical protein